ncbi:hypothetical protein CRUP_005475 [Coryphaenoides rupestris]|nr:hypothetical protein CRUP_005475 [Coryphaenoides rupestris]
MEYKECGSPCSDTCTYPGRSQQCEEHCESGCFCPAGTVWDDITKSACVPRKRCSCQHNGKEYKAGESYTTACRTCTCTLGMWTMCQDTDCLATCAITGGSHVNTYDDKSYTFHGECSYVLSKPDASCQVTFTPVDGCGCAEGTYLNEVGMCVPPSHCPCYDGDTVIHPGQLVWKQGSTCKCHARKWNCTKIQCDGTCTIYGSGHYINFDKKRFSYNGDCGYTFTQDYCSGDMANGTFRVLTENIPCGSTDSICSTTIKLFLGNTEIVLSDETIKVIKQSKGAHIPYKVHSIGIYLVIEAENGLILIWNKRTTVMIKLSSSYKGKVCGLCGNYDGNVKNDFTTSNKEVVVKALQFGNSWKAAIRGALLNNRIWRR